MTIISKILFNDFICSFFEKILITIVLFDTVERVLDIFDEATKNVRYVV